MKVSVIVPVYNTSKYLKKCLNSLVNQTLKDIEIIVINDGSKEEIDDIITEFKEKIVYFKNLNRGIGFTRNFGLKKASGEYLGFVDSDDYVDTEMFEKYYNYAKQNDLDIVVGNYNMITTNKIKELKLKSFDIGNIYNNKEIIVKMDYGPCTKIFKRKMIIDNHIWFEEKLKYEDLPFVIKSLKNSKKIGHLDASYYNYLVREQSESTTFNINNFDIFKILDIINHYFKNEKIFKEELEYLNVYKLFDYNIQLRNQKDSIMRNKFIDYTFDYINKNFPNYKKNKYLKKELLFKKIIKHHKFITKIYCQFYPK